MHSDDTLRSIYSYKILKSNSPETSPERPEASEKKSNTTDFASISYITTQNYRTLIKQMRMDHNETYSWDSATEDHVLEVLLRHWWLIVQKGKCVFAFCSATCFCAGECEINAMRLCESRGIGPIFIWPPGTSFHWPNDRAFWSPFV